MAVLLPRVSVIIPVYNSMPYLTGAIESVLAQSLSGIEIIAIDDGSTDGSGEELDRLADMHDSVTVIHQENSGWPGMPRNRGMERARGEFVFFMDGDDEVAADAFERMIAAAETNDADVVVPRFAGTGGRGVQSLFQLHPEGEMSMSRAMETLSPQKLFRRSLIEAHGIRFPEGKVRLEDGIFVTQCYLAARRIEFCGATPLYFIAKRDDNQNISSRPIDPDGYVESCRRIAELLADGVTDQQEATKLIREFFLRKGLRFYASQRWTRMQFDRKERWVRLHQQFLRDFLPAVGDAKVSNPRDRERLRLIRAGDVRGLDRLVAAEALLQQVSEAQRVIDHPFGVELRVWLRPEPDASLLRSARQPGTLRLRLGNACFSRLAWAFRQRRVRAVSQRLSRMFVRSEASVSLLLSGRKVSGQTEVAGVLCGWDDATGSQLFRFVVPWHLIERFGRDRIDLWTVAAADGLTGSRVRIAAGSACGTKPRRALSGGNAYVTSQGNLSLHFNSQGVGHA